MPALIPLSIVIWRSYHVMLYHHYLGARKEPPHTTYMYMYIFVHLHGALARAALLDRSFSFVYEPLGIRFCIYYTQ